MSLYKIEKGKLISINEKKHILERDIQKVVGENLLELMNLKFIEFEFQVSGKRIDILAFDEELNAPVIIELKRGNDKGLFDQGMEYFNILLNRDKKHVFLTTLAQKLNIKPDIKLISWENSRVVFIGKNFTQRQMRAIDFKGIPIELWDYNLYENNFFELKEVGLEKKVDLDINISTKKNTPLNKIKKEFNEYDLDFHYKKGNKKTIIFFEEVRGEILKLDSNIKENYRQNYISYKLENKSLINLYIKKSKIVIDFTRTKPTDLIDPEKKVRYREHSKERYGQYISRLDFDNLEDIEYVSYLLKQIYKKIVDKII